MQMEQYGLHNFPSYHSYSGRSGSDSDGPIERPGGHMNDLMMLPVSDEDLHTGRHSFNVPEAFSEEALAGDHSPGGETSYTEDLEDSKEGGGHPHMSNSRSNSRAAPAAKPSSSATQPRRYQPRGIPPRYDICFFTSSPLVFGDHQVKPFPQLGVKEARNSFLQILKSTQKRISMMHLTANSRKFIEAVTAGCHVFHYVGHVIAEYLAFEDLMDVGKQHLIPGEKIAGIIRQDRDRRLQLVVAVGSGTQNAAKVFVEAGVEHVVGISTKFDLEDEPANFFIKHFYLAILNGQSVQRSFDTAAGGVEATFGNVQDPSGRERDPKFILLPEDADHNVCIFPELPEGDCNHFFGEDCPTNLPDSPVQPFVGREIDMRTISRMLLSKAGHSARLIVLEGVTEGVGKSATAQMVAKYSCDRGIFPGGVYLVRPPSAESPQGLEEILKNAIKESHKGEGEEFELTAWLRKQDQRMLFVVDQVNHERVTNIQNFLRLVLQNTPAETKVLLTWSRERAHVSRIPDVIAQFFTLEKIQKQDSAKLFARCVNFAFPESQIVRNRQVMEIITESPSKLRELAAYMTERECSTLDELMEMYTTLQALQGKFRKKKEKKPKNTLSEERLAEAIRSSEARRAWHSIKQGEVSLEARFDRVASFFQDEYRQLPHSHLRNILPGHLRTVLEKYVSSDMIHASDFDKIHLWWKGILDIIRVLGDRWYENRYTAVEGFITRVHAEELLHSAREGVFIVRFASKARGLAISFKATPTRITHMLMRLQEGGGEQWEIEAASGSHLHHTLRQFIRLYTPLTHVYQIGNTPMAKDHAF